MSTDERFDDVARAVLEGQPVDWPTLESSVEADQLSVLRGLKIVAAIVDVHRSTDRSRDEIDHTPRGAEIPHWGPLQLIERVGAGSFGEVYRAWDTRLDREVALKLLPDDPAAAGPGSSIIHEGQLLARVRHRNVATIYGAERIDGRVGLWMEFVRGRTIEKAIAEGKVFSTSEAIDIGIELCRAMAAVHGSNLLHRDVKAANVMLADDDRVVLMDFGAVQDLNDRTNTTVAGTPLYLAPEVLNGDDPTVRSDLFSVGVLLYRLLTHSYPVSARSVEEVRRAYQRGDVRTLRASRPDLPLRLAAEIDRAIDADPNRRHENAEALAARLTAVRSHSGTRRGIVAVAAAFAVAAVTTWFLASGRTGGIQPALSFAAARHLTQGGHALSPGISTDGRLVIYVVDHAGKSSLWLRDPGTNDSRELVPPADVLYWQPTFSPDKRFVYFVRSKRDDPRLALYRASVASPVSADRLYEHADLMGAWGLSADGRHIALIRTSQARDESVVVVLNADGSGERIIGHRKASAAYWRLAWSPDGQRLAAVAGNADSFGQHMHVVALDPGHGGEQPITRAPMAFIGGLVWLADGDGLVIVATDVLPRTDQLWHLSASTGAARKMTNDAVRYADVSLSRDSNALVTRQTRQRRIIWIAPAKGEQAPGVIESTRARQITTGYARLGWMPDGDIVYSSLASGTQQVWRGRVDGSSPRQLTTAGLNTDPSISTDGSVIVYASIRDGVQHIWRMDADGGNARQITNGSGESKPRIVPNGDAIVYNDTKEFGLWKVPLAGGEPIRLTPLVAREPAVSPDGAWIAFNIRDKQAPQQWKIAVIPATGGPPRRILDRLRGDYQTFELHWSPDGQAITYEASHEGVSNIWSQPLSGSAPSRLTDFAADYIYSFAWAGDGRNLALVRGAFDNDIVQFSLRP